MKTPKIVCKVLIYDETTQECLLIRRSATDPHRPNQWDIPGGSLEANESVEQAVVRETKEEVGLELNSRPVLVHAFSEAYDPPSQPDYVSWLFFVNIVASKPDVILSSEHNAFSWSSLIEAKTKIVYSRQQRFIEYLLDLHILD